MLAVDLFPSSMDVKGISMLLLILFLGCLISVKLTVPLRGEGPWCEKGSPKRVRFFQISYKLRPELGRLSGIFILRAEVSR
jgi:hypothetical protein